MTDINEKSPVAMQKLILEAHEQFMERRETQRKAVMAQIRKLAASIGARVEISFDSEEAMIFLVKYRNPDNPLEIWSGRGLMPKWLKEQIAAGRDSTEFLVV